MPPVITRSRPRGRLELRAWCKGMTASEGRLPIRATALQQEAQALHLP